MTRPSDAPTSAEVHLWTWRLRAPSDDLRPAYQMLSAEELARAALLRVDRIRTGFVLAHARMRTILGCYLQYDPSTLCFAAGQFGKPALVAPVAPWPIRFNLSHSGDIAVLAVANGFEVGVDVERIRPIDLTLADRFFAPDEAARLRDLPPALRRDAFFYCWTRKEAYAKAVGDGLLIPLDKFAVTFAPNEPARLLYVVGEVDEAAEWQLSHLVPAAGYVGAVAARHRGWRVCTRSAH